MVNLSKFVSNLKILSCITLLRVTPSVNWTQTIYIYIYIERERERERNKHIDTNNTLYMGHADSYSQLLILFIIVFELVAQQLYMVSIL